METESLPLAQSWAPAPVHNDRDLIPALALGGLLLMSGAAHLAPRRHCVVVADALTATLFGLVFVWRFRDVRIARAFLRARRRP